MPRIPYFDLAQAPAAITEPLGSRPPLNIYRMLAHATNAAPGFLKLGGALLRESELDPKLRELAILRVGILSGAGYEVHQHKRIAARVGIPADKIDAVATGPDAAVYTALEKLVLRFTDDVVRNVKAADALFRELLAQLNNRQMAELVLTIGFYMMVSRFLENFEVEIEPPGAIK
ncbi:MAG: carboxymuconolactone decarboxylase [Candidatus Muproteobacteria bacterium RBG_16_60_9]|uniref:Carboxymuconolactone decarboxylase n=1 Tax=Candidatus Muproteobacteria bacterium RBG_16_60_9 TaxID=1817755 RepID=A0A1F6VBI9_9PROT|nr:MAG: carboxymuconolactone decarboxylase [Candidatus Muproteobacteria bacterium RBG_16_60_9]